MGTFSNYPIILSPSLTSDVTPWTSADNLATIIVQFLHKTVTRWIVDSCPKTLESIIMVHQFVLDVTGHGF